MARLDDRTRAPGSRKHLQWLGGSLALALALAAPAAHGTPASPTAEAAPAGDAGAELETIVVTAEKRVTNLQETPISISVLGTRDLEDRHVQSLGDQIGAEEPGRRLRQVACSTSARAGRAWTRW